MLLLCDARFVCVATGHVRGSGWQTLLSMQFSISNKCALYRCFLNNKCTYNAYTCLFTNNVLGVHKSIGIGWVAGWLGGAPALPQYLRWKHRDKSNRRWKIMLKIEPILNEYVHRTRSHSVSFHVCMWTTGKCGTQFCGQTKYVLRAS